MCLGSLVAETHGRSGRAVVFGLQLLQARMTNKIQSEKKNRRRAPKKQKRSKVLPLTKRARQQVESKAMGSSLLRTLLLPGETRPIRLADSNPRQTAIFSFRQQTTLTAPTGGTSFLVFKDAAYPLWQEVSYPSTQNSSVYFTQLLPASGALANTTFPMLAGTSANLDLNFASGGTISRTTTSGTDLPFVAGISDDRSWWYVPYGFLPTVELVIGAGNPSGFMGAMHMTFTASGSLTDAKQFAMDANPVGTGAIIGQGSTNWYGAGWYSVRSLDCLNQATTPLNGGNFNAIKVGYVSGGNFGTPTALGATVQAYTPVTGIGAPELVVAPTIYEESRVNASSFLFQNTTNLLNEDGKIDAAVIDIRNKMPWSARVTNLSYLSDSVKELRYTGLARSGLYTFTTLGMTDDSMVDFVSATANLPLFVLNRSVRYYFIQVIPNLTAQTFNVVADVHHETVNDSMLFPTSVATMSLEEAHAARVASAVLKPFTENPIHIPALLAAARKIGGVAWAWARPKLNPWAHRAVDYFIPPSYNRLK